MTELTIDVPRLRKELEYVTTHREQWLQGEWIHRTACGTVGCLAGNVALNAGYVPVYERGRYATAARVRLPHGHGVRPVANVAAEVLGLSVGQATELFAATNTLYRLWELASMFTGGEIEIPADVLDELRGQTEPPPNGYRLVAANVAAASAIQRAARARRHQAIVSHRVASCRA